MLRLKLPDIECYDEKKEEFIVFKSFTLMLEHSLISISKWESKWCKPFLTDIPKTYEETIDYIKCMTITQNVQEKIYYCLNNSIINTINNYVQSPMTATIINNRHTKRNNEIITSELIYYWMIALNIPFECQKWHLNRLLTLISICSIKNSPQKQMSKREILTHYSEINAARKKVLNTKG